MNKILIAIAAYLVIGALFSIFIKWGNENVVDDDERVDLGNKEHHVIATIWPMFVIVFVVALVVSLIKRFLKWL
jgi:heme/copper-type cytochrome/quinol oxidase subunit 2